MHNYSQFSHCSSRKCQTSQISFNIKIVPINIDNSTILTKNQLCANRCSILIYQYREMVIIFYSSFKQPKESNRVGRIQM